MVLRLAKSMEYISISNPVAYLLISLSHFSSSAVQRGL